MVNKKAKHNQSCKDCKIRVFELLSAIYGDVEQNYKIGIKTKLENYEEVSDYSNLEKIYNSLVNERGYDSFIKKSKLSPVDYYVKNENDKSKEFILEFDESQHFTLLRKISLENYPKTWDLGFDKERWIELSRVLDRHDKDPIYRDEQRAWYDTLRDFAPNILGIAPTVRLYASDCIWCELNFDNKNNLKTFKDIINSKPNI